MTTRRNFARIAILAIGLGIGAAFAGASAPASAPARAADRADHAAYDALLRRYVRDGLVNYTAWRASVADRSALDRYVASLAAPLPSPATRAERLALHLNAYNAITLKSVLDAGPVRSIQDIPRVWDRAVWTVGGVPRLSLNLIENDRIRPVFRDPRVHFALVCAARGCPPLGNRAFDPRTLDADLERLTRAFLNDRARTRIDPARRQLRVSRLFDWYREDFLAEGGSVPTFVARFVGDPAIVDALRVGTWDVGYLDYDWSLNE